jgi:hypothetical protein
MARPQVADGGNSVQIWRVAANILNKQSRTADKGGPPAWGLGVGLTIPHRKKLSCYENSQEASDIVYINSVCKWRAIYLSIQSLCSHQCDCNVPGRSATNVATGNSIVPSLQEVEFWWALKGWYIFGCSGLGLFSYPLSRVISGLGKLDSCRELLKKLQIFPLQSQYIFSLLLFVLRIKMTLYLIRIFMILIFIITTIYIYLLQIYQ